MLEVIETNIYKIGNRFEISQEPKIISKNSEAIVQDEDTMSVKNVIHALVSLDRSAGPEEIYIEVSDKKYNIIATNYRHHIKAGAITDIDNSLALYKPVTYIDFQYSPSNGDKPAPGIVVSIFKQNIFKNKEKIPEVKEDANPTKKRKYNTFVSKLIN